MKHNVILIQMYYCFTFKLRIVSLQNIMFMHTFSKASFHLQIANFLRLTEYHQLVYWCSLHGNLHQPISIQVQVLQMNRLQARTFFSLLHLIDELRIASYGNSSLVISYQLLFNHLLLIYFEDWAVSQCHVKSDSSSYLRGFIGMFQHRILDVHFA